MTIKLRSGKVTSYQATKSKSFNVRGRAANPLKTNIFVSANELRSKLASSFEVQTISKKVSLDDDYTIQQELKKKTESVYLLLSYGDDYLYYGKAPLPTRGPRPKAAKLKSDSRLPDPPDGDHLVIETKWESAPSGGSTSPSRDSTMGSSARNYAIMVHGEDWAVKKSWEWLHIVGHALGGNNEVGNLVAGTYDANTQMIPHEKTIRDMAQDSMVLCTYDVTLFPDTWIAVDITMMYTWVDKNGFNVRTQSFPCTTDLEFDKLQYDLWTM